MSWTASSLKVAKTVVLGLMVLLLVWFLYKFSMRLFFKKAKKVEVVTTFSETDTVKLSTLNTGFVTEVDSDKTADAVLSGAFGPVVVVFYAPWCSHCKNMSEFYEAAAKASDVPFVRVLGSACPASVAKFGVAGYPTIFGLSSTGLLTRFGSSRTKESFVDFAKTLVPVPAVPEVTLPALAAVPAVPVAEAPVVPNMAAILSQMAQAAKPPVTNVTVYQPVPEIISITDTPI